MQNKLYTIQFFSLSEDWLCSQSPSSNRGTCRFRWALGFLGFCQTHEFHRTC